MKDRITPLYVLLLLQVVESYQVNLIIGGQGLQSPEEGGTISTMGHGNLFDPSMASSTQC